MVGSFSIWQKVRRGSSPEPKTTVRPLRTVPPRSRILHCREAPTSYLPPPMWTEDDIQYAAENTEVILAPAQKIATFGSTSFRFYLISELMDQVNHVRVRDGRIHAERPQIMTPDNLARSEEHTSELQSRQ